MWDSERSARCLHTLQAIGHREDGSTAALSVELEEARENYTDDAPLAPPHPLRLAVRTVAAQL